MSNILQHWDPNYKYEDIEEPHSRRECGRVGRATWTRRTGGARSSDSRAPPRARANSGAARATSGRGAGATSARRRRLGSVALTRSQRLETREIRVRRRAQRMIRRNPIYEYVYIQMYEYIYIYIYISPYNTCNLLICFETLVFKNIWVSYRETCSTNSYLFITCGICSVLCGRLGWCAGQCRARAAKERSACRGGRCPP